MHKVKIYVCTLTNVQITQACEFSCGDESDSLERVLLLTVDALSLAVAVAEPRRVDRIQITVTLRRARVFCRPSMRSAIGNCT